MIVHYRSLHFIVTTLLMASVSALCANEPRPPPRANNRADFNTNLDFIHNRISLQVIHLADRLDEFFADDRILEETDETLIRLTSAFNLTEGQNPTLRISVGGRLALPYLEDRFQIFVDRLGSDRDLKEDFSTTPETAEDDKSTFAGLRFMARETRRSRVSLDGGLRWRSGPSPFVRVRGRRYYHHWDPWLMRLTQTFFWFEHRGFGVTPAVDFDRRFFDNVFFRSSSSATWSEDSRGVEFDQRFSILQAVSRDMAVGFGVHAKGHTRPSTVIDEYGLIWRYRQRFYREWLFLEVAPGTLFPRDRDYDVTPTVTIKLEAFFGDIRELTF